MISSSEIRGLMRLHFCYPMALINVITLRDGRHPDGPGLEDFSKRSGASAEAALVSRLLTLAHAEAVRRERETSLREGG